MSRRNRNKFRVREESPRVNTSAIGSNSASSSAVASHAAEYKIISKDLIRLVVLNIVMFGAVLALYFANRSSGFLEKAFQNLVR